MIQKRWFRVESDKDGNVLSCTSVDIGIKHRRGALIRFYEAVDDADACSQAKQWWERRQGLTSESRKRNRQRRAQSGVCEASERHGPPAPGRKLCATCLAAAVENGRRTRERHRSGDLEDHRRSPLSDIERLERAREQVARCDNEMKLLAGSWAAVAHWRTLKRLRALGPDGLEAWLIAHIPNYDQLMAKEHATAMEPLAQAAE